MIEIRNLHKSFGKNGVLRGIDLDVKTGGVVVIIGPSGAGKSTLLRCINLLETPQSGTMKLADLQVDFSSIRQKQKLELRKRTAMVFQGYNLFSNRTALQNITEGLRIVKKVPRKDAEETARRLLEKVGLADRADAYPSQLSGGQQQRIAIARAVAMDPKVILFDEPTSALDPELVQGVLGVMRSLARDGMTMVVVTHEMSFARDVGTDIVFMEKGVIVEQAPAGEFFTHTHEKRTREFLQQIVEK